MHRPAEPIHTPPPTPSLDAVTPGLHPLLEGRHYQIHDREGGSARPELDPPPGRWIRAVGARSVPLQVAPSSSRARPTVPPPGGEMRLGHHDLYPPCRPLCRDTHEAKTPHVRTAVPRLRTTGWSPSLCACCSEGEREKNERGRERRGGRLESISE